tara:strand:- start:1234 stop:1734 length:501 start_codon:yes stop_codon:yes gene_type:complete
MSKQIINIRPQSALPVSEALNSALRAEDIAIFHQPTIRSEDVRKTLKKIVNNKEKSDICFTYIRQVKDISVFNKEEMKPQMLAWKNLRKEKKLVIQEVNNETKIIGGKTFYILVVQPTNEDGVIQDAGIDPLGIGFDEGAYLVSGYIYIYKTKDNRDNIYKYVMGL